MTLEHWNPPKVLIALLHNSEIFLARINQQGPWRLPEGQMLVRDKTPIVAASRILTQDFGLKHYLIRGIFNSTLEELGDHHGCQYTFVHAVNYDEGSNTRGGLELAPYSRHRLKDLVNRHNTQRELLDYYDQAIKAENEFDAKQRA